MMGDDEAHPPWGEDGDVVFCDDDGPSTRLEASCLD